MYLNCLKLGYDTALCDLCLNRGDLERYHEAELAQDCVFPACSLRQS